MELVISCGLFTTKDGFILHTITIDNVFFFIVLETAEIITLEIIVHVSQFVGL
jgi:hypothetical protein